MLLNHILTDYISIHTATHLNQNLSKTMTTNVRTSDDRTQFHRKISHIPGIIIGATNLKKNSFAQYFADLRQKKNRIMIQQSLFL